MPATLHNPPMRQEFRDIAGAFSSCISVFKGIPIPSDCTPSES